MRTEPRTVIFFESTHRIADTLALGAEILGERDAAVCRELTKTYEECRRGTLPELAEWAQDGVRGEITVVVAPGEETAASEDPADLVGDVQALVADGMRMKDACGEVAKRTGVSKRDLYEAVIAAR